jgi:hypothetical protein
MIRPSKLVTAITSPSPSLIGMIAEKYVIRAPLR